MKILKKVNLSMVMWLIMLLVLMVFIETPKNIVSPKTVQVLKGEMDIPEEDKNKVSDKEFIAEAIPDPRAIRQLIIPKAAVVEPVPPPPVAEIGPSPSLEKLKKRFERRRKKSSKARRKYTNTRKSSKIEYTINVEKLLTKDDDEDYSVYEVYEELDLCVEGGCLCYTTCRMYE